MIRKTITILSLIGLLLSVGLWGVSYFCLAYAFGSPGHKTADIYLHQGYVSMLKYEFIGPHELGFRRSDFDGFHTAWIPRLKFYGSATKHRFFYARSGYLWVGIPLWIPTSIFAIMYFVLHRPTSRRRKRKKLGLCLKCGYDLRASKERCPECGQEFVSTN